jgi:hypothetical protein
MDTAFLYGSMKSGGGVLLASLFAVLGAIGIGLAIAFTIGLARSRLRSDDRQRAGSRALTDRSSVEREAANSPSVPRRG